MKISVIMPVYNCEEYLRAAVGSVLSQDGAEIEIIAVDDCSTDGSAELLRSLAAEDTRIKPFFNGENMGVAAVRNIALGEARGDFLAFCDSDDVVPEGAYSALLSAIGDKDIAIGTHADKSDGGSLRAAELSKYEKSSLFRAVFAVSCLWTKLIRRDFVVKHGLLFDENIRIGEDVVFLAHLVKKGPTFAVTDRQVYTHCHHGGPPSLTHIYTLDAFVEHINCRNSLLSICGDIPGVELFVYRYFSGFLVDMLPRVMPAEDRRKAFMLFKDYMLKYDFSGDKDAFRAIVGVPYDDFLLQDAELYFDMRASILPREQVLFEFQSGRIGLRWAVKYAAAWLRFKMKNLFRRR